MSDFVELLWLFNSLRETRNIIRLDLHEAGLLYKYAEKTWIEPRKLFHHTGRGNTILEIGRYWGGSTVLLAMATHNSDVKIVSVDVVEGCHDPDVDDWLNEYDEKERIDIRVDNSHAMENIPISLLFVDGDHSYEGIRKDFIHHWNYLSGECLAHDYTDPTCEGVTKFINEWIEDGYAEIIEQKQTMVALRKLKDYEI
jgi:hypothetical protein|tara:strand:- start:1037 stop:1630 length:594 start_codon:yes stop_codon:yes gene_type:complete